MGAGRGGGGADEYGFAGIAGDSGGAVLGDGQTEGKGTE